MRVERPEGGFGWAAVRGCGYSMVLLASKAGVSQKVGHERGEILSELEANRSLGRLALCPILWDSGVFR